jgi:hypothetical protein
MIAPDTAKPATVSSEPALNVEQLGGPLNQTNTTLFENCKPRSFVGYIFSVERPPPRSRTSSGGCADERAFQTPPKGFRPENPQGASACWIACSRARWLDSEAIRLGIALKNGTLTSDQVDEHLIEMGALDLCYPELMGCGNE